MLPGAHGPSEGSLNEKRGGGRGGGGRGVEEEEEDKAVYSFILLREWQSLQLMGKEKKK